MKQLLSIIIDYFDSLETWKKWLGTSFVGVGLFFVFLLIFAGPQEAKQVAEIPIELKEAQSDIAKQYIEESKGTIKTIISTFWNTGETLSKDINDPILRWIIKIGWLLIGLFIAGMVFFIPLIAIMNMFKGKI